MEGPETARGWRRVFGCHDGAYRRVDGACFAVMQMPMVKPSGEPVIEAIGLNGPVPYAGGRLRNSALPSIVHTSSPRWLVATQVENTTPRSGLELEGFTSFVT